MEEEDQIEKELQVSKSIVGNSNQSIKGRSLTSNPFPALDFVEIEKEIIRTTEEVKKLSGASFIIKMRKKILPSDVNEKGNHFDVMDLTGKKIEIKRFPLLETHFFPLCPFPLVWISLVTIPCFIFFLINLIAVSLVLLTPL